MLLSANAALTRANVVLVRANVAKERLRAAAARPRLASVQRRQSRMSGEYLIGDYHVVEAELFAQRKRPTRERKNMRLDQKLLDSARRVLGTASETETVRLALSRVVDNARMADGIRALGGRRMLDASRIDD